MVRTRTPTAWIVAVAAATSLVTCSLPFSRFEGTPDARAPGLDGSADADNADSSEDADAQVEEAESCGGVPLCLSQAMSCASACAQTEGQCQSACGQNYQCRQACHQVEDTCRQACGSTCIACASGCDSGASCQSASGQ